MTAQQFLREIEDEWEREFSTRKFQRYIDKLGGFSEDDLDLIWAKLLEDQTYRPRIGNIFSAADALGLRRPKSLAGTAGGPGLGEPGCEVCEGSGWEYVSQWEELYRRDMEAVQPCSRCRPGVRISREAQGSPDRERPMQKLDGGVPF